MILKKYLPFSPLSPRGKWIVNRVKGEKILDIGFAADLDFKPAIYDELVLSNPQSLVIGLDINLKKLAKLDYKNTIAGDLYSLPIKSLSVDCVLMAEVFEHLSNLDGVIRELSRVLRKGGLAVITTPSPYGIFRLFKNWFFESHVGSKNNSSEFLGNYDHKVFWEPISLCNLFYLAGFENIEATTTNLSLPYLPNSLRNPNLKFWPFSRLGTYSCFVFRKK